MLSRHWLIHVCMLTFLMLVIALTPFAQKDRRKKSNDPHDDLIRINTDVVQLDVIVTDKNGRPVPDLKQSDFVLLENDQAQKITGFSVNQVPGQSVSKITSEQKASAANPVNAGGQVRTQPRYLVLAIDDLHINPENVIQAKAALLKFIDEQLGDEDQVAVATTSGQLGFFQQFTTDRTLLRRAVNRLSLIQMRQIFEVKIEELRHKFLPLEAALIANGQGDVLKMMGGNSTPGKVFENNAEASAPDRFGGRLFEAEARMIYQQNQIISTQTFTSMLEILRNLRTLPERKVMVLLSEGFLMGGNFSGEPLTNLDLLTDAATRGGVKIYALDVAGLPVDALALERRNREAVRMPLSYLAANTGGKALLDSNDINFSLRQIMTDTEVFYQLAFEPLATLRDGQFHKLQLSIPSRPDLKIRTNKGYFAPRDSKIKPPAETTVAVKTPEQIAEDEKKFQAKLLNDGLASLYSLRGIPIAMDVNYLDIVNREAFVTINTVIDATKLKYDQVGDRYRTQLELACNIYDEKGKLETNFSEFLTLNTKAETLLQATKTGGFRYRRNLRLKPGLYQIRLAVREEKETRVGSAADWLEIPDLNTKKLSTSQIFFLTAEEIKNYRATAGLTSEGQLDQINAAQKANLSHLFKRDDSPLAVVAVYNSKGNEAGTNALEIEGKIFSRGKEIVAVPAENITKPAIKNSTGEADLFQLKLPLQTITSGYYELRLEVRDTLAKTTTRQTIAFKIE